MEIGKLRKIGKHWEMVKIVKILKMEENREI